MSTDAEANPLLVAMGEVAGADRMAMNVKQGGVELIFWRGTTTVERFIADDDPAMDDAWDKIAEEAGAALAQGTLDA